MTEKIPNPEMDINKEIISEQVEESEKTEVALLDENQYYQECSDYALSTGWVKKNEKDILINKYLKPIYQKYLETIEEVKKDIVKDKDLSTSIDKIINKLNIIME